MENSLRYFFFVGLAVLMQSVTLSQEETATNLEVMRSLAKQIAIESINQVRSGDHATIDVQVLPPEIAWYVEGGIVEGLKSRGAQIRNDSSALFAAEFGLSNVRVRYSNIRKDGFFGSKLVDRTIDLQLTTKVSSRTTKEVFGPLDMEHSFTDTIELSEVQRIENPAIAFTRGTLPREGFFSNALEPLILIGSIAIAVLLLFSVRS